MSESDKQTSSLLKRMEGVTVALATPLGKDGQLDVAAFELLVERVIANGAACLFPLGWCGEQPLLTDEVRAEVLRQVCRINAGRLPVMAGISEQSLHRTAASAKVAKSAGADLILATPPYSYPIDQKTVLAYFRELAQTADMPLVVYQNDEVSVRVEVETIQQLSEISGVVGVKAFMPYLELLKAYHLADRPGRFAVMGACEYFFAAGLFLGIRHFTMGGPGNFCLRWCVQMYERAVAGDWDAVREKQKRLHQLCEAIYPLVDSPYGGVKYIMHRLGICSPYITPPLRELPPEQARIVDTAYEQFSDVLDPPVDS